MPKTCAVFIPILTSLKDWENTGILNRELYIYQKHHLEYGNNFIIYTYGNVEDKGYEANYKGIEIIPLNISSLPKLLLSLPFLPLKYLKAFQSVDIIKIDQMWSAWVGIWFTIFFNKKLWARMGYEHYQLQCSQDTHFLKRKLVYLLSLLTYKRASFITVTTENIKDFIVKNFGIPHQKIQVKANYIDTELFIRKKEANIINRLLFIGRIDKVKNLFGIIEGCKAADVGLDIIGKGDLKEEVERFARKQKVEVNFLGIIPNQNLPEVMEKYKYFILGSFHEGNPKSLLEALSMECVCIATNVPGIRGVILHNQNGYLTETDGDSIGKTIRMALSSETAHIQKNARKYIIENNSIESLVSFENELI